MRIYLAQTEDFDTLNTVGLFRDPKEAQAAAEKADTGMGWRIWEGLTHDPDCCMPDDWVPFASGPMEDNA
jgi:hypothetical protein